MTKESIKRDNMLKEFENSFIDIVTAFYYFNLNIQHNFSYIMDTYWNEDANLPLTLLPKECLYIILKNQDISNFFQMWQNDVINLQKRINDHLE